MKKIILFSIFSLGLMVNLCAQDTIVEVSGNEIIAKVLELNQVEARYKNWNDQQGQIYLLLRTAILKIKYAKGYVWENKKPQYPVQTDLPSDPTEKGLEINNSNGIIKLNRLDSKTLFQKGYGDAGTYYRGYQAAGTGTILTTIFTGAIGGLIPAIACSTTTPQTHNLNMPNTQYSREPDYVRGYTTAAKKIKSRKVWSNYGTGVGILLGIVLGLSLASGN